MKLSIAADAAKATPLVSAAWYLSFVSQYGAAVVTTLSIVYGLLSIALRLREFFTMRKKKEMEDGRD